MAKITIADVARAAGTSPGTVSKVLNEREGQDTISKACRKRVLDACEKLNYVRQHAARSLRTGRSYALGALLSTKSDYRTDTRLQQMQFYAPLLSGMLNAAGRQGLELVAVAGRGRMTPMENALHLLDSGRIEGLIVSAAHGAALSSVAPAVLVKRPIVVVVRPTEMPLAQVLIDDLCAMPEVLDHLHEFGHERIAWVGPAPDADIYARRREDVYRSWMREHGFEPTVINLDGPPAIADVAFSTAVTRLSEPLLEAIPRSPRPTALFCYNEAWAMAAYRACASLGLGIPGDMSVVGFDNIYSATAVPAMSVISLDLDRAGARAVELLAEVAAGKREFKNLAGTVEYVPTSYVRRESVAHALE